MLSIFLLVFNTLLIAFSISTDDFLLAFSYALSNPEMDGYKKRTICRMFGGLQFLALIIGWLITDVLEIVFNPFVNAVPYILLFFLCAVGIKLLVEGIYLHNHNIRRLYDISLRGIFLHGLTSCLDALFLGMTFAGKPIYAVIGLSVLVAAMTYIRTKSGLKFGAKMNGKVPFNAGIISGIIIILIAIEIFVRMIL